MTIIVLQSAKFDYWFADVVCKIWNWNLSVFQDRNFDKTSDEWPRVDQLCWERGGGEGEGKRGHSARERFYWKFRRRKLNFWKRVQAFGIISAVDDNAWEMGPGTSFLWLHLFPATFISSALFILRIVRNKSTVLSRVVIYAFNRGFLLRYNPVNEFAKIGKIRVDVIK